MKRTPLKRSTKPIKRSPLKRSAPMKRSSKPAAPADIKEHWGRVSRMGCMVSGGVYCTIHHVHGGSIRDFFGERAMPGTGQKQNDWLVIPLAARYHTGECGIDNGMGRFKGVEAWEAQFGTQLKFLELVRRVIKDKYGYDIYEKAGLRVCSCCEKVQGERHHPSCANQNPLHEDGLNV